MSNKNNKILVDSDVIIHFIKGDRVAVLIELFHSRMVMLNKVEDELKNNKLTNVIIENMIRMRSLTIIPFPTNNIELFKEYAQLIKTKGKGESACLSYCRFYPHIIASSNLKDIGQYCKQHQIAYLTTMDILCIAIKKNVLNEIDCNEFILKVRSANSKLPNLSICEYRNQLFDQTKYSY